jgi:hypothetical protein
VTDEARRAFLDVRVHHNMHPAEAAMQAERSIGAGSVPTRLLYESPSQARAWRSLAMSLSPAAKLDDGARAYSEIHSLAASMIGEDPVQIVGLGCGDGSKEADLASRVAPNCPSSTALVDVSLPLIQFAVTNVVNASNSDIDPPVIVDLESAGSELGQVIERNGSTRRLITLYGILPWLGGVRIREVLGSMVGPDDLVCVSANLVPGSGEGFSEALSQYDNQPTREWLELLLERLGVRELKSRLRFELVQDQESGSGRVIVGVIDVEAGTRLNLDDAEIPVEEGRDLQVFKSIRHRPDDLADFCDSAGLDLERLVTSPSGQEGVALASVRGG